MKEKDLIIIPEKIFKQKEKYKFCKKDNPEKELAYIEVEFLDKSTRIFMIDNLGNKGIKLGYKLFMHVKNEAKKRGHKYLIAEWISSDDGLKFFKKNDFSLMDDNDYVISGYDKDRMGHKGSDYILKI